MAGTVNLMSVSRVDRLPGAPATWLFPLRCLVCGEAGARGQDLCLTCHATLPWQGPACRHCASPLPHAGPCSTCGLHPLALDAVHAAFDYRDPIDRLLPRLKFHHDFAAGLVLVQCMAARFSTLPCPAVLVPVPLHRARLRRRGYDQALELARPLARTLGIRLDARLLQRCKATSAQSQLNAETRHRNLSGAFAINAGVAVPTAVTLFDDVMTTGATLHAAASALRVAGVQHVEAWVCARVA